MTTTLQRGDLDKLLLDFRTLEIWGEKIKTRLIDEYDRQGRRASGAFERGLEVKTTSTSVEIIGEAHSLELEYGRGKTQNAGDGSLKDRIEEWIQVKPIIARPDPKTGIVPTKSQLAFLITRKIHRDGWKATQKAGGKQTLPLISQVITEEAVQELLDDMFILSVENISRVAVRQIKQFAEA